nr:MAG TPA: hypothetical protein [Bacteriophage sp.]
MLFNNLNQTHRLPECRVRVSQSVEAHKDPPLKKMCITNQVVC